MTYEYNMERGLSITPCRMIERKWIITRRWPDPLDPSCVPLMNTNEGGKEKEWIY